MGKKEETGTASSGCSTPLSSASDKVNPDMGEETINLDHHPNNNKVMGHHQYHQHRSLVPKSTDAVTAADDNDINIDGGAGGRPNQNDGGANEVVERSTSSRPAAPIMICSSINSSSTEVGIGIRIGVGAGGAAVTSTRGSAAAAVRTTLQPFDISIANAKTAAFKSPGGGMAAAATLGFPFTPAQWKELERQAMIYKYMIASVPVPPDLLFPVIPARNSPATDPSVPWNGNGAYLRYGNTNKDLEPGRCKRTDGKKWRCSRDVAPHQKYCERHMHRGRPRSRKHVELHQSSVDNNNSSAATNISKKPRLQTNSPTAKYSSSPQFLGTGSGGCSDHKPKEALFLDQQSIFPPANNFKQPSRVFGWTMEGENAVDQQWLHLMDTKRGMEATEHDSIVYETVLQQQGYEMEEPLNLFSYSTDYDPGNFHNHNDHDQCHVFLNNSGQQRNPTRGFIDAWSNGDMKAMEEEPSTMPSSKQNLWPSDMLTLSMALDAAGMGLATPVSNSEHKAAKCCPVSWQPFHSGGPLAEVLGPSSSIPIGSNPASPFTGNGDSTSPPATSVSSPTGILHRALFSQSDSSVCNSPTLGASNATPDLIAFQWLN